MGETSIDINLFAEEFRVNGMCEFPDDSTLQIKGGNEGYRRCLPVIYA